METSDDTEKKKVKKTFPESWLNNEEFNSWVRRVPYDATLFHCLVCSKNFNCSSLSHVKRHANSMQHKKNLTENTFCSDSDKIILKKKSFRKKLFRQQWLDVDEFRPWLSEVPNDPSSFSCKICAKVVSGGLSQIHRHGKSVMHKTNFEKYIQMKEDELNDELNVLNNEEHMLFEDQKKIAEIRYAALIAEKTIPLETAKIILNFFQDISKNPKILQSMCMGRTKCSNIISNVLCPIEMKRVVKIIQNVKFSIFIDETLSISKEKWLTFHVRYVNPDTLEVHSQLIKLMDIDTTDCSEEKLFNTFEYEMWKLEIPISNIIALTCDSTSESSEKHFFFKKRLEELCENIIIISCPCHSVTLAMNNACINIPETCEDFAKKVASCITNNCKRNYIFREFSDCFQERNYILLKLFDMRWLSHHMYIKKLIEFWDAIECVLSESITSENIKSGENLLCVMQSVDTKAYLLFLQYSLQPFTTFSAFFQSVETRLPFLQSKLLELLGKICSNFLKSEILDELDIQLPIFNSTDNHKPLVDIEVGKECEDYLNQLLNDGYTDEVATIRQNCLQFYITAAEEICEKLPINNEFLSTLSILLPDVALSNKIDRQAVFDTLSFIAKTMLGTFDEDNLRKEWSSISIDFITEKDYLRKLNFDDMWKHILQSRYSTNELKYPVLTSLLNSIRTLPNSNVDPEKILSFLIDTKTKKRNKLSSSAVNATCVVKSALKSRKETALNMDVSTEHLSLMTSDKLYLKCLKKPKSSQLQTTDEEGPDTAGPSFINDTQT
ncbi:hypothetical protein PUN28_009865 [Cardiocondyla obscurior]|uniref:Uncharacterized protein n=1 Tax=Cardiocondyla obscurior TaxID=286306 RepID=A0AAW2FM50_9HYME